MSESSLNEHKTIGRRWLWSIVGGVGALIHFGTALLRLETFFPYPQLTDFAAFYAGAWSIRIGVSPYEWSFELLERLRTESGLFIHPPIHHSLPLWAWLLQPLTFFDFRTAAFIWLLLLLVLVAWSTIVLVRTAGYGRWKEKRLAFLLVITFGPVFLNLTLGQNGLFLLIAVLIIGQVIRAQTKDSYLCAALAWVLAIGAKLFPLIWLWALPFLRRWRLFVFAILTILLTLSLTTLLTPTASQDYWFRFLPERIFSYSEQVEIDDQSLVAWLDRLGRPHTFATCAVRVWHFQIVSHCGIIVQQNVLEVEDG